MKPFNLHFFCCMVHVSIMHSYRGEAFEVSGRNLQLPDDMVVGAVVGMCSVNINIEPIMSIWIDLSVKIEKNCTCSFLEVISPSPFHLYTKIADKRSRYMYEGYPI